MRYYKKVIDVITTIKFIVDMNHTRENISKVFFEIKLHTLSSNTQEISR